MPESDGPFEVALSDRVERTPLAGEGRGPLAAARARFPIAGACFLEPVETDLLPVTMFGAGHVGRAIAARAAGPAAPLRLA